MDDENLESDLDKSLTEDLISLADEVRIDGKERLVGYESVRRGVSRIVPSEIAAVEAGLH